MTSTNHGQGSNHYDGSDRQIFRAVAESCGWQLERIADELDVFIRPDECPDCWRGGATAEPCEHDETV